MEALAQEALARYVDRRGRPLPVLGVLYAPLAVLAYVRDDLATAEAYGREALVSIPSQAGILLAARM